ncbi:MAG: 3-deoxy-7-phosphoheptulonate synthase class II [Planctomycetota bacterium]|nr:MAG: 3-deoxy-7-phosphoheptulonate synthase class II [Planctomycetota bacterium]REK21674.1 MAG: 3-deoxy-7-phosphoheptulonate synthase class II [Planctomycetota bacterium]REK32764.1 MAG: 3-deoxy-7-phosphoheptulonate synthase class II [Planctomycetota bacterium]
MTHEWSPSSWRTKPARQQVAYPSESAVADVFSRLSRLPPLVTSWEIETLKSELAAAARGEMFLLQGGDCCESFDDCQSPNIAAKLKILLQMSVVLIYGCRKPVIRAGRFAGQFAKPRSSETETRGDATLPVYRGDLINRRAFTLEDRRPDPELLLRGYERAGLTLNFIRSLVEGGFADLHHPEYWDLGFVSHSPQAAEYHSIVQSISDAISLMESVAGADIRQLKRAEFYTSHEGLHLPYEESQTRQVPRRTGWYNLTTHFPWIGDRTRALDEAHVEYFRGIRNPIGVKIGPSITGQELVQLIRVLDPEQEPGRLTLIHRFGADQIAESLPALIEAVQNEQRTVLWCCDPMHGNTTTTADGLKTRRFESILSELEEAFAIHERAGSILGGVHFELTGENVTECTGGARGLKDSDLREAYKSAVDPRLNYEQAMEMALLITHRMNRNRSR